MIHASSMYEPGLLISARVLAGKDVDCAVVAGHTQQRRVLVEVDAAQGTPLHHRATQYGPYKLVSRSMYIAAISLVHYIYIKIFGVKLYTSEALGYR